MAFFRYCWQKHNVNLKEVEAKRPKKRELIIKRQLKTVANREKWQLKGAILSFEA
jgi:hypothetical protein